MQFPIPNSAGHREIDEANTMGTHAYLQRGTKAKKRKVREFNTCHSAQDGTFCSNKTAKTRWKATLRRAADSGRANRVMRRLEHEMHHVGGNVKRAITLRKRMDVAGPVAYRNEKNSFIGTFKRIFSKDPNYHGRKR